MQPKQSHKSAFAGIPAPGLGEGTSLYFDVLRLVAAVLVVIEHLRLYGLLPAGFPLSTYSHVAVIAFFVLSGAVIAHTADRPTMTLRRFVIARMARIYSVSAPAILWAFALSSLFAGPPAGAIPQDVLIGDPNWSSAVTTFFFLNETWFIWNEAWWNGPYWSLCYEVWYYAIFTGFWFLRGRRRWITAFVIAAIAGPRIVALFPVWLLGVGFARFASQIPRRPLLGAALFVLSLAGIFLINDQQLAIKIWGVIHSRVPQAWRLQASSLFVTDYLYGLLFLVNFIGIAMCERPVSVALARAAGFIRGAAGSTFSVYLFHYPLVLVAAGLFAGVTAAWARALAALIVILAICALLSLVTERRKDVLVKLLGRLWEPKPSTQAREHFSRE